MVTYDFTSSFSVLLSKKNACRERPSFYMYEAFFDFRDLRLEITNSWRLQLPALRLARSALTFRTLQMSPTLEAGLAERFDRLRRRLSESDALVRLLRAQIAKLSPNGDDAELLEEERLLRKENAQLCVRVEQLRSQLLAVETVKGFDTAGGELTEEETPAKEAKKCEKAESSPPPPAPPREDGKKGKKQKEKKEKKKGGDSDKNASPGEISDFLCIYFGKLVLLV